MAGQPELQELLETIVDHVYFQPPSDVKMVYPAIVYHRTAGDTKFAGDNPYLFFKRYTITVIDYDPDSGLVDMVAAIPTARHSASFVADNLNQDVFEIYF